jgi:NAD(P)-dependent dehydrogenase (short-subunit alcohol dehydrogenase family)
MNYLPIDLILLRKIKVNKMDSNSNKAKYTTRREALKAVVLGAGSLAATSVLGTGTALAQESNFKSNKKELSGKTAFITGGARGIGLAVAEEMANVGANVVIYDIATEKVPNIGYNLSTESDLQLAKTTIEKLGVKCIAIKGDVRNFESIESAMAQAVSKFGSLDIVVANAGVTQAGSIEEFSEQEISVIFEINVAGVIKTTQAAAPIMKKQKSGRIIYISSALGRMGNELFPVYTSSKWAVIGFAKSAALAFAKDNVMCNVICPALVNTKLANNPYILNKMAPNSPTMETVWEMLKAGNPIAKGYYEPIDIAKAVMIFASEATAQVTGEVFDISFGTSARNIG